MCIRDRHYTEYASADIHEDFASLRPHILIQYVNYSGLESFWTYHSQSAGRAGTIHINDYTGNLILEHETFSLSGSRLPVGLSHVYNSSEAVSYTHLDVYKRQCGHQCHCQMGR